MEVGFEPPTIFLSLNPMMGSNNLSGLEQSEGLWVAMIVAFWSLLGHMTHI